jgi:2,3-bisphosphoglycerate-independent phosphoglycerate mutase
MYRGLARLLGMELADPAADLAGAFDDLRARWEEGHDFLFLHVKGTDSAGEDGDFGRKVGVIEEVDALLPRVLDLGPDVVAVTSDHSTPAAMARHSWHPVPVLVQGPWARRDAVTRFDEIACAGGVLGLRPGVHLMGLALANAGRLAKFGA